MGTLAVAFAVAWSAVAGYVLWLGAHQRRLGQRLNELTKLAEERPAAEPRARAA